MTGNWEFQHSFVTKASRPMAWTFWSNLRNHEDEPGVDKIELDGPFETGTTGRTMATEYTQEWKLTEVIEGRRFVITGLTPDGEGSLSFEWEFEDDVCGTRMTQRITATGPDVVNQMEMFRQMEAHAPKGMAELREKLDHLALDSASE